MNQDVNKFVKNAKLWPKEIVKLRALLLKTKLNEEFKWSLPCYTYNGSNVVIVQPFKACLGLMFFKGSLLKDPKGLLEKNGPNSQATRRLEFRSVEEIAKKASTLKAYINEAIAIEKSGQKVVIKKQPHALPVELKKVFAKNAKLKASFSALTPGRQRAYVIHFSSAKHSETRMSRIEKCIPRIMKGIGLSE